MNTCTNNLPTEAINEDKLIYTTGDSILNQFFYGNYTDALEEMVKEHITPMELADYLEEKAEEYDTGTDELYGNHFTISFFAGLGESYARKFK